MTALREGKALRKFVVKTARLEVARARVPRKIPLPDDPGRSITNRNYVCRLNRRLANQNRAVAV